MMQMAYGEVTDVADPENRYRVKVKIHSMYHAANEDQTGELWALVTAPFAGENYGAVTLPNVGETVLVGFRNGDPSRPVVLGALYLGQASPSEQPVDSGAVKRWGLFGQAGTHVMLDESGGSKAVLKTAGGVEVSLDDSGTVATVTNGSSTITIDPAGVKIETGAKVDVQAASVDVSAGMVNVNAGLSKFSGVVQCDTLITNSVVSTSYTPGAGNVW